MDEIFKLTSSEYARMLGISNEALRSRRRRGQEDGNFKEVDGKFFFKSPPKDRPYIGSTASVNRKSMLPVSGTKKRRRGVLASGKQTNYGNARNGWQLEELNRVRALGKIRDELGDEVMDEVKPELFELAKKRVAEKKEKEFQKTAEKAEAVRPHIIYGVDPTPTKYGTMLNAEGLKRHEDRDQDLKDLQWRYQTDVKLLNEPGKRHVPDFYTPPRKKGFSYTSYDSDWDDSVEVYVGQRSSLPANEFGYSKPRNFKSKLDEAIWDAEQKLKKK